MYEVLPGTPFFNTSNNIYSIFKGSGVFLNILTSMARWVRQEKVSGAMLCFCSAGGMKAWTTAIRIILRTSRRVAMRL